jgi:hypothetical protein
MKKIGNMYEDTKTWNPFVGCMYDCVYCIKSYKRQLKRVGRNIGCEACFNYSPHYHPERLKRIPGSPTVFVYGTGDIAFCDPSYARKTFSAIDSHRPRRHKMYYFQSKNPKCFNQYLDWFQANRDKVVLLTTLETNRDYRYNEISKAPLPSKRFQDFLEIDYDRKALTIEPALDFDVGAFLDMILKLKYKDQLEYVWFGYDSKNCGLPEPSIRKAQELVDELNGYGIKVRGKTLRGVHLYGGQKDA